MINFKVRFKNPVFYVQLILALVTPVFAYTGLAASDITSWAKLWDVIVQAVSNPYVIFLIISSLYNAVVDPTTRGVGDSSRAASYNNPAK